MGIEPITCRLQGGCSAIELRRQNILEKFIQQSGGIIPEAVTSDKINAIFTLVPAGVESIRIQFLRQYSQTTNLRSS
jgi:hypothetical protein